MSSPNEMSLSQGYSPSTLHQAAFTWTIAHFSYCTDLWSPVFNEGKVTQVKLCLDPNVEGFLSLTIYPQLAGGNYAQFKVSFINSGGEKILIYDKFNYVYADTKIELSKFTSRIDLFEPSNGYLPSDTLKIHCEFAFLEKDQNILREITGPSQVETTQKAMADYGSLLKSGNLADVKLIVGGKTLPAHKSILSVRSPVFAAMFANDLKEKMENQVEIPDVDAEAFETFLKFLYTGAIPTLENAKSAQELLLAVDKYDVAQLKTICEVYLISQITIETAPSLLLFANTVNTPTLKKSAHEVIGSRCSELVDDLKSEPDQLINLLQYLAIKGEEREQSK